MYYGVYDTSRRKSGVTMVGWGRGNTSSEKGALYNEGLSCCIGVGIYDTSSTIGYLAHLMPTIINNTDVLAPMLEAVDKENDNPTHLTAWVRGGTLPTPNQQDYNLRLSLRSKTLAHLAEVGILQPDVQWNDNPYTVIDMALYCDTGGLVTTSSYTQNNSALHTINNPI